MEQKIRQLYKRLAKYRRKRDHAIHMIDSIDTEINDLHRLARRQHVPPPATRTHNICAGVRCLTCSAMYRMLRSDPTGSSWEQCWHCTCFRCSDCREAPCECLKDMDTPRSPSPEPTPASAAPSTTAADNNNNSVCMCVCTRRRLARLVPFAVCVCERETA